MHTVHKFWLVAVLIPIACVVGSTPHYSGVSESVPRDDIFVRLHTLHWYVDTLYIVCSNDRSTQLSLRTLRGLVMNEKRQSRVGLRNCSSVTFIAGIQASMQEYHHPATVTVIPGQTICITIASTIRHSSIYNCTQHV